MTEKKQSHTIQAVIFDLDGVLMDSEWLSYNVWREILAQYGADIDETTYSGVIGTSAQETAEHMMRVTGVSFDIEAVCVLAWQRLEERLIREIESLPGSVELVGWLAQHGYQMAIASNSSTDYINKALRGLKLGEYFPVRAGRDQVPQGKPAPDVYLCAAERLGVAPQRCLAIEDSRVGVQAAVAAGMRVIAVPSPHDPNRTFDGAWQVYPTLVHAKEAIGDLLV